MLSLRGRVHVIEPLGGSRIVPFTELYTLSDAMRGFLPGRVLGSSVAVVHLEYAWPLWAFLDGALHFAVGNAFGDRFADFDFERLRMSFGVHIAPRVGGEHFFELGVAFGTETFARGGDVTSVRFVIGGRNAL